MNFVLVNGRTPYGKSFCGLCCQRIGNDGYLRDIRTQLCYCNMIVTDLTAAAVLV
jgi:hypothetical protein